MNQKQDKQYMRLCLELAKSMAGFTSPRPMVGCVIVKDGKVIGKGVTQKNGVEHGEVNALKNCTEDPAGATVYTNLEPCSHVGKNPACSDVLIRAGVKRVVCGISDPNKKVDGEGIKKLRKAGIEVEVGILEDACKHVNRFFFFWIQSKLPYVLAKVAISKDFKISEKAGVEIKISGKKSQNQAHFLRHQLDAILVGVGTVLTDDPELGDRSGLEQNDPLRIILDAQLKSPLDSKVFRDKNVFVATSKNAPKKKMEEFKKEGIEVVVFSEKNGNIDLHELLKYCGSKEITSVMVEGGKHVFDSFMKEDLINEWHIFQSKKNIGEDGLDVCSELQTFEEILKRGERVEFREDSYVISNFEF